MNNMMNREMVVNPEEHIGLVNHIVTSMNYRDLVVRLRCEFEDLISIGKIGLIKACKTFNPDKGWRFPTYASTCIRNEILMSIRNDKKKLDREAQSMEDIIYGKDGDIGTLGDLIPDNRDRIEEVVYSMVTEELMTSTRLTKTHKKVLRLRMKNPELNQEKISQLVGLSQSLISRKLRDLKDETARLLKSY